MEEFNEYDLNHMYDNINYAEQRQELEDLKNKYLNPKKSNSSNADSNSQYSLESGSSIIRRTKSDSSNASNSQQSLNQINTNCKSNKIKEKPLRSIVNKNKSKYENVVTIIDSDLLTKYGQQITHELETLEMNYKVKSQVSSNLVSWILPDNELDLENECNIVLLILNWKEVTDYISSNSFITYIKTVSDMLVGKKVSLGLYGFVNYFKYWKLQKQPNKSAKINANYSEYRNSNKINRHELEYVLTELELRCSCCHRFLENTQDIIDMISQYTKSIAQLPEKLEKQYKYKNVDFYLMKDNRDCVMVDKNGNGLKRLWQQQLTTFDMVRLETAEAIMLKYPTPSQLFDGYTNCSMKSEGVKLLEDIPIRRAAGPLTSSRKIGAELGNKIYNFLNSTDGNMVI